MLGIAIAALGIATWAGWRVDNRLAALQATMDRVEARPAPACVCPQVAAAALPLPPPSHHAAAPPVKRRDSLPPGKDALARPKILDEDYTLK
jgi:hypothetical protein